jgi:hypothetical protein
VEEDSIRIFPRSSAFEALLAKVYVELWELQDNPAMFARRVETFVSVFFPTMFQTRLKEKFPDLAEKLVRMEVNIDRLEQVKTNVDPFTEDAINNVGIPVEEADFAREVWHAAVDILTEAGFNFPVSKTLPTRLMR